MALARRLTAIITTSFCWMSVLILAVALAPGSMFKMTFKSSYFKADLFKVLSNPIWIQILDTLLPHSQGVGYIAEWLEIEASSVSQQLAVLRSSYSKASSFSR